MKYRAEIDGLRALAVIPVILFHAGFELFSGGFVGVDIFFVISGYLITTILIEDIENNRFSLITFYEKRAKRILPALFFVMIICIPFAWAWMLPSQMDDFSQSLIAVSLFASNILFWQQSDYFAAAAEEKPLLHTWSLAVEEQYYLLFPVFLMLTWRFGKDKVFWMIVATASISLFLSEWGWRYEPTANFYLAPTRAWELFAGSIAAFVVQKKGVIRNDFLALCGLTLIVFSIFAYGENTPFPSIYALVPVVGVVLLVLFGEKRSLAARILSNRVLVGIGLISYSAYLWHQPLFAFSRIKLIENPPGILMLFLSICSLFLAYLSWKFIEQPARAVSSFNKKKIFNISVTGLAFFIFVGYFLSIENIINEFRFPNKQPLSEIYSSKDSEWAGRVRSKQNRVCEKIGLDSLDEEVCFTNSTRPKILIAGDSKAMALSSTIFAGHINMPTILISAHSCPIFPNLTYTPTFEYPWGNNCTEISNRIYNIKKDLPTVETVIIANRVVAADEDMSRYFMGGKHLNNDKAMKIGYSSLIEKLLSDDLQVVFLTDVPKLKMRPLVCFYRDDIEDSHCNASQHETRMLREKYYANLNDLSKNYNFKIFDSLDIFCPDNQCLSLENGKLLYFDKTHLTPSGAYKIMGELLETIDFYQKEGESDKYSNSDFPNKTVSQTTTYSLN